MGINIQVPVEKLREKKLFVATPMYGGNCAGMFARSIADLSALCTHYGIQIRFYFLFNESLITRARNYCCDEFLRSGDTHMLFIDADIGFNANDVIALLALQDDDSPYDVIAAPYPKKCLHHSANIMTEDGQKTISWVVKNQYSGKVLSYTQDGKQTWSTVTKHWSEPNNGRKQWVSLRTSSVRSRDLLTVTSDHEVAFVDDIFSPEISFIRADQMKDRHLVVRPTKNANRRFNALYNKEQISALIGTILGDGSVGGGSFGCGHGPKQKEYVGHKANLFNANLSKNGLSFTITNAQTKLLGKLIGSGKNKTLKNVIDLIDPISLAYLYMDDGHLYDYAVRSEENGHNNCWVNLDNGNTKRSSYKPEGNWIVGRKVSLREPTASIATMGFSVEDNQLLVDRLQNVYGISSRVMFQSPNIHGNKYPFIAFDSENTKLFHDLIKAYVHPSMEYKLVEEYRNCEKSEISSIPLEYSAIKVDHIVIPNDKNKSHLYDIEVENTHNFIANDVLVHNCISWEKIKLAVDKGVADEEPNNLEKFVGDYVFNPKSGATEIPLGEPVEVLETGTGFMMIRRKTFEMYANAYPEYLYKPDHVRTEHFDGSREIMAYFDCIIDPVSKRYLSEDYMFCQNLNKIGAKIWLCPWMQLQHVGSYIFGGSLADLASVGASATADISALKKKK